MKSYFPAFFQGDTVAASTEASELMAMACLAGGMPTSIGLVQCRALALPTNRGAYWRGR